MALALHLAAKEGRCKVVTKLLADNPSLIDTRDERGRTALHYASKSGHEDVLKQLLVHMPELLSAKDNRGKTLLHVATNDNLVAHLLGKSPELVAEVDMRGRTALHFAAKRGDDYIVARLLANCPRLVHVTDEHQRTVLHYAAAYGHEYVLNLLFEVKSIWKIPYMIDMVDSRRWTVLHFAVHGNIGFRGGQDGGHDHIVARLLKTSCTLIHATDVDGRTALHLAARGGSVAIVKRLLATRPKLIDETTRDLKTALHEAVQHGQEAMVVHLLAQNPKSIEAEDWQHRNVLHYAARFGHDKIAALLLAHTPALLKQYDWRYPHALDLAVESGHDKVVALCLKKDPLMVVSKNSLRVATSSGFVDVWTQLLAHCPKMIDTEFEGQSPAFVAAESGKEPLVNMLLAVKPQVFRIDNRGNTLLHYLTRNPVFSHTLVEKVWRMNMEASRAVNGNFHTPFDRAVMAVNTPAIELLQWHLTYEEVASAYERFASLEGLRSLIDKQCESLSLVLLQDLIATIYEFLGLQRVQRQRTIGEKRKEMEPDEKPYPHPLLELLPQAKKRETKEKKRETKEKKKKKKREKQQSVNSSNGPN